MKWICLKFQQISILRMKIPISISQIVMNLRFLQERKTNMALLEVYHSLSVYNQINLEVFLQNFENWKKIKILVPLIIKLLFITFLLSCFYCSERGVSTHSAKLYTDAINHSKTALTRSQILIKKIWHHSLCFNRKHWIQNLCLKTIYYSYVILYLLKFRDFQLHPLCVFREGFWKSPTKL